MLISIRLPAPVFVAVYVSTEACHNGRLVSSAAKPNN